MRTYFVQLMTRKRSWQLAGLLVVDSLVFNLTNTGSAPAYILIVGFVLLMVSFYYLMQGLLAAGRLYGLAFQRKRHLAGYLTLLTGFLLALQSMGELNSRDVLVLLPLSTIGYGYSLYSKAAAARIPDM